MDAGGMETFVMNVYRTIDRTQVQFDFLYHYNKPCFYDDEIAALGGRITKLTVRQDNNIPRYLRQLDEFFAANPYRIIHGHYSGFGMFYNRAAKRRGVPVRVGHSHNTAYEPNLVGTLDRLMSSRFDRLLTDRFACSQKAGEMLFGKSPFTVLPNGIRVDDFAKPEPGARERIRAQWQVPDGAPLLGHVGAVFQTEKPSGAVGHFRRGAPPGARRAAGVAGRRPAGRGGARQGRCAGAGGPGGLCRRARRHRRLLCRMDAFLLPSLFEGLPVVLVEAQAAGLPCFVSDTVDPGAAFADGVHFLPLDAPEAWAQALCGGALARNPNARRQAVDAGYDIRTSARVLQQFYIGRAAGVTP